MTVTLSRLGAALLVLVPLGAPPPLAQAAPVLPPPLGEVDFAPVDPEEAALGQLLFYDPILSGNRNISCASCHHPRFGTSDGLSLGLGEGATGLGPARHVTAENRPEQRIPRNAPALFNLNARAVTRLFHDGRIEVDPSRPSGLRTPMEEEMVTGFASVLSAQTMFPVLSPDEMAGHYNENEVSKAVRSGRITGPGGAWDKIAARVRAVPAYQARFAAVYPEIGAGRALDFTDISNAIAAFMALEWRSDSAPFDAVLRGEAPLAGAAAEGAALFYGELGCAGCHAGPLLSDQGFHAMGAAQIGPGKAERFESHARDEGRMRVTGRAADRFAFRTPMLRNVLATGPWGHAGAEADLRVFLRDHAARGAALAPLQGGAVLPDLPGTKPDFAVMDDPAQRAEIAAAAAAAGPGRALSPAEVEALMAFFETLSDPVALNGRLGVPAAVPSGLPVER